MLLRWHMLGWKLGKKEDSKNGKLIALSGGRECRTAIKERKLIAVLCIKRDKQIAEV